MVRTASDKMSKSVGNVFVLHEALAQYGRDALIMYFCGAHYRQPVEFDAERLAEAAVGCRRIREGARGLVPGASPDWSEPLRERFFAALAADFNTPGALAAVFDWVREANRRSGQPIGDADLRAMLDVLGLANLADREVARLPAQAQDLLDARERARAGRDFARADAIRDELRAMGWDVRDGPDGPGLVRP